ncbi:12375_t:CDS:2 [Funneliformis geosporum]|uniref:12375_t:CDS:1 n=1 Tax=Funneliformis geosporum TaxID=1117311 RepID=A0A9W4SEU6_9GLOM|nr:12375_t:CDS:2 [Funneliformis geosporum]
MIEQAPVPSLLGCSVAPTETVDDLVVCTNKFEESLNYVICEIYKFWILNYFLNMDFDFVLFAEKVNYTSMLSGGVTWILPALSVSDLVLKELRIFVRDSLAKWLNE